MMSLSTRFSLFALLVTLPASAAAQLRFVGQPAQSYEANHPAMRLPTALALAPDGSLLVADGVNHRIVTFAPDGTQRALDRAGESPLRTPTSVHVDADGQIYVADTGNHRGLVFDAAGAVLREYPLPAQGPEFHLDLTDFVPAADQRSLWAVDNENHRLLKIDRESGVLQSVGGPGASLGQFEFPFFVTPAANGDIFVSDVLNGRVQVLNAAGTPAGALGRFGVEPGELYRPKAVALDADDHVWIADSVLGVIQVFARRGEALGVLEDAGGNPLRLQAPTDLAFAADGSLYVVELAADRVTRLQITRSGRPAVQPAVNRVPIGSGQSAQACTICHLDWMPEFKTPDVATLISRPHSPASDPYVSHADACLSCHDGSVADSRRAVWLDHGHATNVAPPPEMTVPPELPLVDGKLACRTCHSAHGPGAAMGDIRRAVMLRTENVASTLCKSCHVDKVGGPRFGTHPTGGMPWPIPENLIDAGAKVGPDPRELTCQVCHTPHGAHNDHLLVLGTNNNQLCLSCHERMRPGMFRDGEHTEHPLTARVNAEQQAAVERMGTKLGDDNQLICLSCHKLHHGKGERFLLAADLNDGQMCLSCHSERSAMVGSSHDLRTNFPAELNRLGLTPTTGGPCSACHLFHRYARELIPGPSDASGHCLSCHRENAVAHARLLGEWNHPGQRCEDCHDPHETRFSHFLREQPEQLCASCHQDQATLAGGGHDPRRGDPDAWTRLDLAVEDRCLACHSLHSPAVQGPFRVARGDHPDAVCLSCHPASQWHAQAAQLDAATGARVTSAALHPQTVNEAARAAGLPLVRAAPDAPETIGCRTCHDPHGGPGHAEALLRAPAGAAEQVCLKCHTDVSAILQTAHAPARFAAAPFDAIACGPCHRSHAGPDVAAFARLAGHESGDYTALYPADYATDPACMECHRDGGGATHQPIASHPPVAMVNPTPGAANELPLVDEAGKAASHGRIACRTCHLPHGRELAAGIVPGPGMRLQLRPFVAPNTCTTCHGVDALRRYLYFHDPVRRGPGWTPGSTPGPDSGGTSGRVQAP